MKHETDFAPLDQGFGQLPDAPLPMPKQVVAAPRRPWLMTLVLSLLSLARSRP